MTYTTTAPKLFRINGPASDFTWEASEDGSCVILRRGDWYLKLEPGTILCFNDKKIDTGTLFHDTTNKAPVAVTDNAVTDAGKAIEIDVVANDTDPDKDKLNVSSYTQGQNGTVVKNPNGTLVYTPKPGFSGTDTFTYTVTDGKGGFSSTTVSVVVVGTTTNTVDAVNDTGSTTAGKAVTINVLSNDKDAQGDTFVIDSFTQAANGTVVKNADGTFSYTPKAGFTGTDTFTYTIKDAKGALDTATVTVTVGNDPTPVNQAPTAVTDTGATKAGQPVTISVLGNDTDPEKDPLSVISFTQAANGTVVQNANGTFVYTPKPGFTGNDSFVYTITDGKGGFSSTVVNVTVAPADPVNTAPTAVNDTGSTKAGQPVTISVLGNDTDPEKDPLSVVSFTQGSNGTVVQNANGTFVYTPKAGFTGQDSYTYTITDGKGGFSTATVNVTVAPADPVNTAPTAVNDAGSTKAGQPVTISVLGNDTDPEKDPLSVVSFTQGSNGTVVQNANGTFVYTPKAGFTGQDSYTYTITDGKGGFSTATVNVTVTPVDPVNTAPTAVNDTGSTKAGQPVTISVLGNDTDPEKDPLSVVSFGQPSNGTVTQTANGTFVYTPKPGFTGQDSYTYTITDGKGGFSTATVNVTVTPGSVTAVNDAATAPQNATTVINVLGNDSDPEGDTFSVTNNSQPLNGTVVRNADGTFSYTPRTGFSGEDFFTYEITDATGAKSTATVKVTVPADPNSVDAVDDTASTTKGQSKDINVVGNDKDAQGDTFKVTAITSQPLNGTVTINADGTVKYTPNAGFVGTEQFTYEITDSKGAKDTAVATVKVEEPAVVNTVDAVDDTATYTVGQPKDINVLANDKDAENDTFKVTAITKQPANGTVTINADGTVKYTPNAGFSGADEFTYEITDAKGAKDTAVVKLAAINDVDAVNDTATTRKGQAVDINVVANDKDAQGDTFKVTAITQQPANGTVTINPDGTVKFTPAAGFVGTTSFTYEITDSKGAKDTAVATVTVGDNTVKANNDQGTTGFNKPVTISVLGNDTDAEGDKFTITSNTQPSNGTVVKNADGTFTYTPKDGFSGSDSFTYTITDDLGATSTATVNVTVGNNTVTADDDTAATRKGKAVDINVVANDKDAEGNTFKVTAITQQSPNGVATINPDGTVKFTPNAGFSGAATFVYEITDAFGAKDTASVTVNVADNTVKANNDTGSTGFNKPVTISVLGNDTDAEGDKFTITSNTQPSNGTVVKNADGTFTYTPKDGFSGSDSFTYTITDDLGATSTATVNVTVDKKPNSVDAANDTASTRKGNAVNIDVLKNDSDPENDTFKVTAITQQSPNGVATINADGTVKFTPNAGFVGAATFTYEITDAQGAKDTATVTVNVGNNTVSSVNDSSDTAYNKPVTINVLGNDSDAEGDKFTITSNTQPSNGTVVKNADGTFTYTPEAGFSGQDSYTYTITDEFGATSTATVVVNVGAKPNTAPVAAGDDANVKCGENGVEINVLGNDTDADGDTLEVIEVGDASNGTVVLNADGTISYMPNDGFYGQDTFTYVVSDGNGGEDTATVTVNVEEPRYLNAHIVGDKAINEGQTGCYAVELDDVVSEDTWFTIKVANGTAERVDRNDQAANNQDFAWGGYVTNGSTVYDNKVWNGQYVSNGLRDAVGPDGFDTWDYTVLADGVVQVGGELRVLVKAGESSSSQFNVKAFQEKVLIDNDGYGGKGAHEGTENFNISITNVQGDDCDVVNVGTDFTGEICDTTCYVSVSPVAIDLSGNGQIDVTGATTSFNKDVNALIGETVDFDMDSDGVAESIEWLKGTGDALVVDMTKIGADGSINGSALMGDDAGTFNNGFEKMKLYDTNSDGMLSGEELSNLGLWADDGDAKLEVGEMKSAADFGIESISTEMEIVMSKTGLELMQSTATTTTGEVLLTEDVWFANDNPDAEVALKTSNSDDNGSGC